MATYVSGSGNPHYCVRVGEELLQFKSGVLDVADEAVEKALDELIKSNRVVGRNVRKVDHASVDAEARRLKALQKQPNAMKGGLTSAIPEKLGAATEEAALKLVASGATPEAAAEAAKAVSSAK